MSSKWTIGVQAFNRALLLITVCSFTERSSAPFLLVFLLPAVIYFVSRKGIFSLLLWSMVMQVVPASWLSRTAYTINPDTSSILGLLLSSCVPIMYPRAVQSVTLRRPVEQASCSRALQQLFMKNGCIHVLQQINCRATFILHWYVAFDSFSFPCNRIQHIFLPMRRDDVKCLCL